MKVAFVIPWYGKDIPGGAELECRRTALNLKKAGVEVEILTTCVKDFHSDWSSNFHEEKVYEIEGLTVRRFLVKKRNSKAFDAINLKLMNYKARGLSSSDRLSSPVSPKEEKTFIEQMINSPHLYDYINNNKTLYDFFVFIPYMFGTSYYGSRICPEKTILIPCLHDEPYAYMRIYKEMFERSGALVFNSRSELNLTKKLYDTKDVSCHLAGIGVDSEISFDGLRFRKKYGITGPFILYVGRKDSTKNVPLFIDYFLRYRQKNSNGLKVVLIGPEDKEILHGKRDDILDIGFVSQQDKYDAYAASLLFCQPSLNESFSIVVMEAWLTSTPVLVHSGCSVTRDHCISSGGGLFFSDYEQFERHIDFIISNPHIAEQMGKAGKSYVLNNYSWENITRKYLDLFDTLKCANQTNQNPVINIMTASFTRGDAIGNYIKSLADIFVDLGYFVNIFADNGSSDVRFRPSSEYKSTGRDILWFHYSIYSENLNHIKESSDFKVMDFHGVTPSNLFKGYHKKLEELTRKGERCLKRYVDDFNLCLVHSDYTFNILEQTGYSNIVKSPLMVSDELYKTGEDQIFSDLLSRLEYLLFVGRIVPQKDILSILRLFSELKKIRQNIVLFLVGPMDIAHGYVKDVFDMILSLGLEKSIYLTDKIVDSDVLASFYKYAKFSIILSEWETFCIPIVESMFFKVPVIGIRKTCVPETIGDAGILLDVLDFEKNAQIINEVWADGKKYNKLRRNCEKRARLFGQEQLKTKIMEIIQDYFPKQRLS